MNWNDIDPRTWRSYENARTRYAKNPALYRLALFLAVVGFGLLMMFGVLMFPAGAVIYECGMVEMLNRGEYANAMAMMSGILLFLVFFSFILCCGIIIPVGMPLDPERYGRLYDLVGGICRDLNIPPVRLIRLDQSCRATVFSRFLVPARMKRDILYVGYPLVCALDEQSLRICLTRTLRRQKKSRDRLMKCVSFVWADTMEFIFFEDGTEHTQKLNQDAKTQAKCLFPSLASLTPIQRETEESADAFCREEFGADRFAAFVTQERFRTRRCDPRVHLLQSLAETDSPHPAAAIRDKIRETFPEVETERILGRMLRAFDPLTETLPAFRERVRTDDPAALKQYLEQTPDAAEHYLLSCPEFEAEYDAWLESRLRAAKTEDIPRRLREAENLDESSADPALWSAAAEAAACLGHAGRERGILEKALEKFPGCLPFRGRLLVRRMKDAASDEAESKAAAELERLTAEDPRLVLEFCDVLFDFAARRGDGKRIGQLFAARTDARERVRRMKQGKLNGLLLISELIGSYVWMSFAIAVVTIMFNGRYGFRGYAIGTAVIAAFLGMCLTFAREKNRNRMAERSASPDGTGNRVSGIRMQRQRPAASLLPKPENHPPVFPAREKDALDRSGKYCHLIAFSRKSGLLFLLATLFMCAGLSLIVRPWVLVWITDVGFEAYEGGDFRTAVKWFRVSAELGDSAAQALLGSCYQKGKGVEQDFNEMVKWNRRAAEDSKLHPAFLAAQNNLGEFYEKGVGVEQDFNEAVKWYRLAAENGFSRAQNNLGKCYENGTGVEQDHAEAAKWYYRAALLGNAQAQINLAICYELGLGVEQNPVEAVKWYRRAFITSRSEEEMNLAEEKIKELEDKQ